MTNPYTEKLTGRLRYRSGGLFKKKVILQVEILIHYMCTTTFHMSPGATTWRDATIEDITEIKKHHTMDIS